MPDEQTDIREGGGGEPKCIVQGICKFVALELLPHTIFDVFKVLAILL